MARDLKFKLVVVMAHELRTAAKAVQHLQELLRSEEQTDEALKARKEALKAVMDACFTALHGVDDNAALMLLDVDSVIKWNAAQAGEGSHEPS